MEHVESNSQVNWAKHYDRYEVEYRDIYRSTAKRQNDSHFEMLKNYARKHLVKSKCFCEIGFGAGLTLRNALGYFGTVYGLDISPKNVILTTEELKKEGYTNFELFESDIMKFDPRWEKKFDVISFIHGLEHFSNDDYPIVLENIRKYLKDDGIFTGALPNQLNFTYRTCPFCDHTFEIDGHLSIHTTDTLKSMFNDNNYKIFYLKNFNREFFLKKGNVLRRIAKYIYLLLIPKKLVSQIEYIVSP